MPSTASAIVTAVAEGISALSAGQIIAAAAELASIGLSYYRTQSAELDRGDFSSAFESQASKLSKQIKQPVVSRRVVYGRTRLSGAITTIETQNDNTDLHYFLTLCDGPIEEFERFFVNGERVFLNSKGWVKGGKYSNLIRIRSHKGSLNQTADGVAIQEMDTVDSSFRGRGIAYLYIKAKFDREVFSSIPEIQARIKGRNTIWDPRDGSVGYTNNSALCTANYLMDNQVGLQENRDSIDTERLITAANVCDESVELEDGSFQSRYRANGVLNAGNKVKKNLSNLLSSMAGRASWSNGSWNIFAGSYSTPSVSLDEGDRMGGITVQGQAPAEERYNGVRGVFRSKNEGYQPTDFPFVSRDKWLADDDGVRRWKDIDLPFTSDPVRAQRIALVHLERARRMVSTTWNLKMTALKALTGETVELSDNELGWDKKPFRTEEISFKPSGDADKGPGISVQANFKETESSIYDWIKSEEKSTPSGNTKAPDAARPTAPTNVTLTSGSDEVLRQADGELVSVIRLTWDELKRRNVRGSVQAQTATVQGSLDHKPDGLAIIRGTVKAQDARVFGIESEARLIGDVRAQDASLSGSLSSAYDVRSISGSVQAQSPILTGLKANLDGSVQAQDATVSGSISPIYNTSTISGTVQPIDAGVQGIKERNLVSVAGNYHIQWREKDKYENSRVWPNEKRVDGENREAITSPVKAGQVYQVRLRKVLDSGFASKWVQKEVTSADPSPSSKNVVDADDIIVAGDKDADRQVTTASDIAKLADGFLYTESGTVTFTASTTPITKTVSLSRSYSSGIASLQSLGAPGSTSDIGTVVVDFDENNNDVVITYHSTETPNNSFDVDWEFFGWSNA